MQSTELLHSSCVSRADVCSYLITHSLHVVNLCLTDWHESSDIHDTSIGYSRKASVHVTVVVVVVEILHRRPSAWLWMFRVASFMHYPIVCI